MRKSQVTCCWSWEAPSPCWRNPACLLRSRRTAVLPSWDCWNAVSPFRKWRSGTPPFESGEFLTIEQETVHGRTMEYLVHLAEVSYGNHGVRLPAAVVDEQSPVVMQHGDLGEQGLVSGSSHYISTCGLWLNLHAGAKCGTCIWGYTALGDWLQC